MADPRQLDGLIRSVRACFHRLAAIGDALHGKSGVSVAMRGVMESLYEKGPQTAPGIAREKMVSRQHIQVLVDQLIVAGLATVTRNPAHKRSHLVELTDEGERVFGEMRTREKALLTGFSDVLDGGKAQTTLETLQEFNRLLEAKLKEGTGK